jgi:error-prone DNA polymerase
MGFYAPAQIVGDARKHGVDVRPLDINASDWDCTLEPAIQSANQHALRLGLRFASGLAEEEGRLIVKVRRSGNGSPYASVEEVARRTGVSRKAIEALAEADAFTGLGTNRRAAMWEAKAIERDVPPLLRLAESALGEPSLIQEPAASLPAEAAGQSVVLDYQATGLTLRQHPLALLRPGLHAQGYHDTRRLNSARPGSSIRLPGIVLMRQRPGTAKGIVFVTLEDEFGVANLVVYPNIGERDRAALIGSRLLVAEGWIERETEHAEVPVTHLICRKLTDRSNLLGQLSATGVGAPSEDTMRGRVDAPRRHDPGSARAKAGLPASRDFR